MISLWILLSIGVGLLILEILFASFFLMFVGIGFIITAILGIFIDFESLALPAIVLQSISVGITTLLSLVFLRKPLKRIFSHSQTLKENFLDSSGEGVIQEGMVYFKGTLWKFEGERIYNDGDKVRIKGVKNNRLILEP